MRTVITIVVVAIFWVLPGALVIAGAWRKPTPPDRDRQAPSLDREEAGS
jgi:hypothetical protein